MKSGRIFLFIPFIALMVFALFGTSGSSKRINSDIDLTTHYNTINEVIPTCERPLKPQVSEGDTRAIFANAVLLIDKKYQPWFITIARFRDQTAVMTTGLREWPADVYSCWPEGIFVVLTESKIFFGPDDAFNAIYTWDETIRINNTEKTLMGESLQSGMKRIKDQKLIELIEFWTNKMNSNAACFENSSVSPAMLCP